MAPEPDDDPCALDASALSSAIHARRLSCRELMAATLDRVARLNPRFNAIVSLRPAEHLLREADACDAELARGRSRGWLHGIPQAIKDASHAAGLPTTFGSTLLAHAMATHDSLMTERMRRAGCIVIGKTNLPEFGLGSHTYNRVFGITRNAWDRDVSAGGSSGGAAVALAQRLLPVADGSDFMGSLRNPAGWNHVFGLRPSQGRVPLWPTPDPWLGQLATEGPMARSVRDLARLLATQAGPDARAPLAIGAPFEVPADLARAAGEGLRGVRIGWLGDLGGHLAIEDGLLGCCERALQRCSDAGARVEPASFGVDLDALWNAWLAWRHLLVGRRVAAVLARPGARRDDVKPEALWELDQGRGLSADALAQASEHRGAFHAHLVQELFERFDLLALPTAQVWPFAAELDWPRRIGARTMDTYHRWMEVTIYATFAGLPALSVPAGFHANGRWPAGLQWIGRPQGEAALLRAAAAYEHAAGAWLQRRPPE